MPDISFAFLLLPDSSPFCYSFAQTNRKAIIKQLDSKVKKPGYNSDQIMSGIISLRESEILL